MNLKKAKEIMHGTDWAECDPYAEPRNFKSAIIEVLEALAEPDEGGEPTTGRVFIGKKFHGDVWVKFDDIKSGFVDAHVVCSTPPDRPREREKTGYVLKTDDYATTCEICGFVFKPYQPKFGDLVKKGKRLGLIQGFDPPSGLDVLTKYSLEMPHELDLEFWQKQDVEFIESGWDKKPFVVLYHKLTGA